MAGYAPAIRGFSHHGITLKFSFQNLENLLKSQFFSSFWSVLGHDGRIHELLVRTPPNNEKRFKNFHRSFQTVKALYHVFIIFSENSTLNRPQRSGPERWGRFNMVISRKYAKKIKNSIESKKWAIPNKESHEWRARE